ncbi:hypothetical protein HW509_06735 [Asaia spathodeae]|uniref:hypothetical protein n=1 Tax=Asaia spathodeae TaxID=657016 RepID=UPI002FC2A828
MAWIPATHTTFTGPVSAGAAGSQLQNGWYDVSGNIWSINAQGQLASVQATTPKNNGLLSFPFSNNSAVNQRASARLVINNPTAMGTFIVLRSDLNTSGATEYEMSCSGNGMSYFLVSGGNSLNGTNKGYTRSLVAGEVVTLTVECIQGNGSTVITGSVVDSTGATLASLSVTDTTAAMQNKVGTIGIFQNEGSTSANGAANLTLVQSIDSYYYSAASQPVSVSDSSFLFSPGNWTGDNGRGGSVSRRAWNCGAWFEFSIAASASPVAVLALGSYLCGSRVNLYVNGIETASIAATGIIAVPGLTTSATNLVRVEVVSTPQNRRWNGGVNSVLMLGAYIDPQSAVSPARALGRWGMMVGSSITEGALANNGADYWPYDYSGLLASSLRGKGIDICMSAACFSDYVIPGDSDGTVPPYYMVSGGTYDPARSRWNLCDKGVSLLDANQQISAYGATGTAPDFVLINYCSNAAGGGWNIMDLSVAMYGCMTAIRAAASEAYIFIVVPFGFHVPSSYPAIYLQMMQDTFARYQAANPADSRIVFIDIGESLSKRITYGRGVYTAGDGRHPFLAGHALVAPVIADRIREAMKTESYSFF